MRPTIDSVRAMFWNKSPQVHIRIHVPVAGVAHESMDANRNISRHDYRGLSVPVPSITSDGVVDEHTDTLPTSSDRAHTAFVLPRTQQPSPSGPRASFTGQEPRIDAPRTQPTQASPPPGPSHPCPRKSREAPRSEPWSRPADCLSCSAARPAPACRVAASKFTRADGERASLCTHRELHRRIIITDGQKPSQSSPGSASGVRGGTTRAGTASRNPVSCGEMCGDRSC